MAQKSKDMVCQRAIERSIGFKLTDPILDIVIHSLIGVTDVDHHLEYNGFGQPTYLECIWQDGERSSHNEF